MSRPTFKSGIPDGANLIILKEPGAVIADDPQGHKGHQVVETSWQGYLGDGAWCNFVKCSCGGTWTRISYEN